MNKGLTKDVYLYFNNEADNDNIATTTNGCFPAKNLVNMAPTGDSLLSLYFKSMMNSHTNGTSEEVVHDVVTLTLKTANTHLAAMTKIVQAINNQRPNFGGFVDVCDDHTVIVGGAALSRTAATGITFPTASTLEGAGISACATIATKPVNTGLHTNAVTATADGLTTGVIPAGTRHATVTSAGANNIVLTPPPVPGTVVFISVTANGCEVRAGSSAGADASDTISIGGNSASAGHESDLAANETMMAVCTSATTWVAINIASNNAVSAATVAG